MGIRLYEREIMHKSKIRVYGGAYHETIDYYVCAYKKDGAYYTIMDFQFYRSVNKFTLRVLDKYNFRINYGDSQFIRLGSHTLLSKLINVYWNKFKPQRLFYESSLNAEKIALIAARLMCKHGKIKRSDGKRGFVKLEYYGCSEYKWKIVDDFIMVEGD